MGLNGGKQRVRKMSFAVIIKPGRGLLSQAQVAEQMYDAIEKLGYREVKIWKLEGV
ncbi:MAG: hypothetical protein NWF00_04795 [Candidatus Bathyarchaeota archaeon]|nr:hypothetical protein [Candidatus Bathyarchaeota archaeon]